MLFPFQVHVAVPVRSPRTYRVGASAASLPHAAVLERLAARADAVAGMLPLASHTLLQALEAGETLSEPAAAALAAIAEGAGEVFCPVCFHRTVVDGDDTAGARPRGPVPGLALCQACFAAAQQTEQASPLVVAVPRYRVPASCWDTIGFHPLAVSR